MDVSTRLSMNSAAVLMPPTPIVIDSDSDSSSQLTSTDALITQPVSIIRGVPGIESEVEESGDENAEADEEDGDDQDWSEVDSMLEEALETMTEAYIKGEVGLDACSAAEADQYRTLLRAIGPEAFCAQTVENGSITAKKLLTAFGVRPPAFLDESPDDAYYPILSLAIGRELSKRIKLPQYNTIDDAVELIKKSKNIIVLTGAGISTSLGIRDFRSKDGLYAIYGAKLGLNDPQEIFDIEIFKESPGIFYQVARDIIPDGPDKFSPTHAFIAMLQEKGKLLTNYSQNIDNIEAAAGILPEKLIQCHGSFATASCVQCKYQVPGERLFPDIKAGKIPMCPKCASEARKLKTVSMKRKRSYNSQDKKRPPKWSEDGGDTSDEDDYDEPKTGVMKPDITFFGEALPSRFGDRLSNHDKDLVDLVIVIGTSLKVAPVSEVIPYLPAHIPQMYISKTPVSHVNFDVDMLGNCDVVVAELCKRAGWDLKHDMIPEDQVIQVRLQDGFASRHIFESNYDEEPEEGVKMESSNGTTVVED